MSGEYIPFLNYRDVVDPRTITTDLGASSDEEEVPSYVEFTKKKTTKRGKVSNKRRKVDPPIIPSKASQNNVVVIDDDDEDEVKFSPAVTRSKTIILDNEDIQVKMQDVPGFSAAMSAISQNKRLRSEIRKSSDVAEEEASSGPIPQGDAPGVTFSVHNGANDPPLKFLCLPTEPFQKLLSAYCSYKRLDLKSAVLKWYGITLDPQQTPVDLGMTNEEQLDFSLARHSTNAQPALAQPTPAPVQQQGPAINTNTEPSSAPSAPSSSSSAPIPGDGIVLKLRQGEIIQKFRIKKTDHVRKLLEGYCKNHNLDPSSHSLHFDGLPLALTDTPLNHDMEDGDLIDVEHV